MNALPSSPRLVAVNRPRVLCVDDEPQVLAALASGLQRGFDVVTAEGGAAALRVLATSRPFDVIVSDFEMPGMNGPEFLGLAGATSPGASRVLLTGQASIEEALEAVSRGRIFRFLVKPCAPADLVRTLEDAAEHARVVRDDRAFLERRLGDMSALLLRTERLATLGTLTGAVAHELNNMLAVFGASFDLIEERANEGLPPDAEDLAALAHVRAHLASHIRHLRDLGRPTRSGSSVADIGVTAEAAVAMLTSSGILKTVVTNVERPAGPVLVALDRTRAEQVMVNLLKNAADAIEEVSSRLGKVTIRVACDPSAGAVDVEVADNGCGISEAALGSIFEPYFTTKGDERGTGLGLFVVKQIVESCGGRIAIESAVGKGTTFALRLPLLREAPTRPRA